MTDLERIKVLIAMLLDEMPEYRRQAEFFPCDIDSRRKLVRVLMNVRPPMPMNEEFVKLQDQLLQDELREKGVVEAMDIPVTEKDSRIAIWRGDITRLRADAVVNGANSGLVGCFIPCHDCIDNVIHSAAGIQLRDECARIMEAQGHDEPVGTAKITSGYNLPAAHVIHTVGPEVTDELTEEHKEYLVSCYRSCLELAEKNGLESVAFCCISTGLFGFPSEPAAEIAVRTVKEFLDSSTSVKRVIFDVFKDEDEEAYRKLLG